jgi:hypothetical protein
MIDAGDNHNGNPGDVEKWDFATRFGLVSSPFTHRLRDLRKADPGMEFI